MITRQRLEAWIEEYDVRLTPEAVDALLALGHDVACGPDAQRQALARCGALEVLRPLALVFRAAVRYRDCWTPNAMMSVSQASRELTDAVRQAEEMIRTDRDVDGRRPLN